MVSSMSQVDRNGTEQCHCMINITLSEELRPPWNFYYGMRNYYQNHRRYLNSWDVNQLRGEGFTDPSSDCRPYVRLRNSSAMEEVDEDEEEETFPVMPCGLIANSFFNGEFLSARREGEALGVKRLCSMLSLNCPSHY